MGGMDQIFDYLSWASIIIGSVFSVIGAIGMLRMPDVFTRMHASSLIETMGAGMIFLGLGFQAGLNLVSLKLLIIFLFLLFTNPTTTHALARALHYGGIVPVTGKRKDGEKEAAPSKT